MVIQKVEQDGIVFIDEIDKIAKPEVIFLFIKKFRKKNFPSIIHFLHRKVFEKFNFLSASFNPLSDFYFYKKFIS